MTRQFDLILYGATGFTGRQAAHYLAQNAPSGLRWAVAGRNREKLEALGIAVPILVADADNPDSLQSLAASTKVIFNTAGPFRRYGDPLVAACIANGTHYCDISGETARIRDLIDRWHVAAIEQKVRIVPFCGASSAPADIATYLLDTALGNQMIWAKAGLTIAGGMLNGGTVASIIDGIESGDALREQDPFLLGPTHRPPTRLEQDPAGMKYDQDLQAWAIPSAMGRSDTRAIRRSNVLRERDFQFQEYFIFAGSGGFWRAKTMNLVLGLMNTIFRYEKSRRWLASKVKPGQGPTEEQMASGFLDIRVQGATADGRRAEVHLRGKGDPGNRITVKFGVECALALALQEGELPHRYGLLTPAAAFGEILAERLCAADVLIETQKNERAG